MVVNKPADAQISSLEPNAPYWSDVPWGIWNRFSGPKQPQAQRNEHQTWAGGTETPMTLAEGAQQMDSRDKSRFPWVADL